MVCSTVDANAIEAIWKRTARAPCCEQEAESTDLQRLICRSPGWHLEPLTSTPLSHQSLPPASLDTLPINHGADALAEPQPDAAAQQQGRACSAVELQQALPASLQALLFFRLHPPSHPAPARSQPGESRGDCLCQRSYLGTV